MPPHTQRPAGLVVAGDRLTLGRRRDHLAFPSTGRRQENAPAQHLALHTASAIYTHTNANTSQSSFTAMPQ